MAKGYWISRVDVEDAEIYRDYLAMSSAAVAAHGGRFLVRGGRCEQVEGKGRSRQVVLEFDSYEKALACYRSDAYQAAVAARSPASVSDIVVVEGVD